MGDCLTGWVFADLQMGDSIYSLEVCARGGVADKGDQSD